jgi:hypothetical protein
VAYRIGLVETRPGSAPGHRSINYSVFRNLEIDEFLEESEKICTSCGGGFRLIDESKIHSLPLDRNHAIARLQELGVGTDSSTPDVGGRVHDHSYARINVLVSSGLLNRRQLRRVVPGITPHEVEVAEAAYWHARPLACGCSFGEPTEAHWESHLEQDDSRFSVVESEWMASKPSRSDDLRPCVDCRDWGLGVAECKELHPDLGPVKRTRGRRSAAALARRRAKRAARHSKTFVVSEVNIGATQCMSPLMRDYLSLRGVKDFKVEIQFKYLPQGKKWTAAKPPGWRPHKRSKRSGRRSKPIFNAWYTKHY